MITPTVAGQNVYCCCGGGVKLSHDCGGTGDHTIVAGDTISTTTAAGIDEHRNCDGMR